MNSTTTRYCLSALFFWAFLVAPLSQAEPLPEENHVGRFERAVNRIDEIAADGDWDVMVSGYALHSRSTYAKKRISKLNEKAWGGGIGKTLRNERGNDESIYLSAIRDSNKNIQWSAGYAYQWIFPVAHSGIEAGAGLTAVMIRRDDWFNQFPFPAVLPVFSIGTQKIKLTSIYVPHVSTRKGKGDVFLFYVKFTL